MGFRPRAGLEGIAMELFTQLFGDLLAFVYHCFDRIVIYGYLSGLSRPKQVVHFFRQVVGVPVVSKEVLSQRTADYQAWVEPSPAIIGCRGNRKTTEGDSHPDRDAQFGYINTQVTTALAENQPVISVDTKKKELVGDF